jgi:hypothetical protein
MNTSVILSIIGLLTASAAGLIWYSVRDKKQDDQDIVQLWDACQNLKKMLEASEGDSAAVLSKLQQIYQTTAWQSGLLPDLLTLNSRETLKSYESKSAIDNKESLRPIITELEKVLRKRFPHIAK